MPNFDHTTPIYLGIDPGANGGLAALDVNLSGNTVVRFKTMPKTERDIFEFVFQFSSEHTIAVVEKILPGAFGKSKKHQGSSKGSVAKLYGSYTGLRMALAASNIRFLLAPAITWHKGLYLSPRKKDAGKAAWKQYLKSEAERIFPELHITLATADALLIAHYCKVKYGTSKTTTTNR